MTSMAWRLAWRLQRFEIAVLIGLCLLLAVVSVFVAWQLEATTADMLACYQTAPDPTFPNWPCRWSVDWGNALLAPGPFMIAASSVAPFAIGLFLGAPLVAREIEKRTAPIAWSLSLSRRRWLAGRVVPLVIVIGVALLILGQASDALQAVQYPNGRGFADYGSRGPLIAARGLAVFAIGVVVGLKVGRVLPAILVTGLVTVGLLGGVEFWRSQLMRSEAVWIPAEDELGQINMIYDSAFVDDATGERLSFDEVANRFPDLFGRMGSGLPPGMSQVYLATPPAAYPRFVARESGVLIGVAIVAGATATLLVTSRRPE